MISAGIGKAGVSSQITQPYPTIFGLGRGFYIELVPTNSIKRTSLRRRTKTGAVNEGKKQLRSTIQYEETNMPH